MAPIEVDLPNSPPAAPVIPVGLGTKLGTSGVAVLSVLALTTAVLKGDHSTETLVLLVSAVGVLIRVIDGRYKQAAAIYRDSVDYLKSVGR